VGLLAGDLVNEIPRMLKAFIEHTLPLSLDADERSRMSWVL
jgi:hypothetical protein